MCAPFYLQENLKNCFFHILSKPLDDCVCVCIPQYCEYFRRAETDLSLIHKFAQRASAP